MGEFVDTGPLPLDEFKRLDRAQFPGVQWEIVLEDFPSDTELTALWDLIAVGGEVEAYVDAVGSKTVKSKLELKDLLGEYAGFVTVLGNFDQDYFAVFPYVDYWLIGRRDKKPAPPLAGLSKEEALQEAASFDSWGARNIRLGVEHYLS
ncbi:hypothetical protein BCF74_104121 [Knoellia remsis]|uniref:Uncharacterized protein n=1 Tax=Knoellia remsis TaxID=407159 RepID=A0A2T0UXM8_9MICO|nr:hypothetical protein [Knoellia remsis]PRY62685.1 hypothetical protein BCF74_104121 [Knoellia remsis]